MKNKDVTFRYEGEPWFFDVVNNRFIGPRQTIKSFHPLFARLEAARDGRNVEQPPVAKLILGAL